MKTAIIGVGAMGGAIARGLLASGIAPADLILANPHTDKLAAFAGCGAAVTASNVEAAAKAGTVILAVKPWLLKEVVAELTAALPMAGKTVISVAAGIPGAELAQWLGAAGSAPDSVALAIPNTAAALRSSMTFVVPVNGSSDKAVALFERVGDVQVTDEAHLPASMALASCGIAYAMRYIRAAQEGGVELGIRASEAQRIVCRTVIGAAGLLLEEGAHPEAEIDKVTTPGGLTIRGLNAMEAAGFTPAVIAGLRACLPR